MPYYSHMYNICKFINSFFTIFDIFWVFFYYFYYLIKWSCKYKYHHIIFLFFMYGTSTINDFDYQNIG